MAEPGTDYPAAHSMDTTWFAVDQAGHIARFDSGEGGAVPTGPFPRDNSTPHFDESPLIAALLTERAKSDERLAALLPSDEILLLRLAGGLCHNGDQVIADLGIFSYRCFHQVPIPYNRVLPVTDALTVEAIAQLHAPTADRLSEAILPTEFKDADIVQPAELVECALWSQHYSWRATDGSVVSLPDDPDPEDRGRYLEANWEWAQARFAEWRTSDYDLYTAIEHELASIKKWEERTRD